MISFLAWFNPGDWLKTDSAVVGVVIQMFRSVFFYISTFIYDLIIKLYNLFYILSCGRLLDGGIAKELTSRIGLILGIMMFFIVSISFIKMLIDPDSITDKVKGATNIIMKIFVVIVCLGFSNFIFNSLYRVQRVVVQNNIISRILLPYEVNTQDFGEALSLKLFLAFYRISDDFKNDESEIVRDCRLKVKALDTRIREYNDFELGLACLNESAISPVDVQGRDNEQATFIIDFNWFLSIIVGAVVAYFLFSYSITVGVRMIQLAFLEIVSPMAIVSHLMPTNDTPFNKWIKLYLSTYVDVFIKIAIINFVVFLIAVMFDSAGSWEFWNSICLSDVCLTTKETEAMTNFVMVAMILALLTFAKKVPDLINKLIPVGDSGLGSKGFSFNDLMGGSLVKAGLMGTAAVGAGLGLYGASKGVQGAKWAKNALLQKTGANSVREALGFRPKGSGTGNAKVDKALKGAGGVLGFLGGGVLAAGRAGWSGRNSKDIFGALSTGSKAASQSVLSANQRAEAGVTTGEYVSDRVHAALGLTKSYDKVNKELEAANNYASSVENNPFMKKIIKSTSEKLEKRTTIVADAELEYSIQKSKIEEFNNNNLELSDLYSKSKTTTSIPELGRIAEKIKVLESRNQELQSDGPLKSMQQIEIERDSKINTANKLYEDAKAMEDKAKNAIHIINAATVGDEDYQDTVKRLLKESPNIFKENGLENYVDEATGNIKFDIFDFMLTEDNKATWQIEKTVLGSKTNEFATYKEADKYRFKLGAEQKLSSKRKS